MAILAKIEKVRDELVQALTAAAGAQRADAVALALSQKKVAELQVENSRLREIIEDLKKPQIVENSLRSPKIRKSGSPPKSPEELPQAADFEASKRK